MATMDLQVTIVSKEDAIILKNKKLISDCIPYALCKIIEWGCSKSSMDTFEEHIRKNILHKISDSNTVKKWLNKNLQQLQNTSTDSFDVTLLYNLVSIVCTDIAPSGSKQWEQRIKNVSSVEFLMKQAKDCRNSIAHDDCKALAPDLLIKTEDVLVKLIGSAGLLYSVSHGVVDAEKKAIADKFKSIEKNCVDHLRQYFTADGRKELKERWVNQSNLEVLSTECNVLLRRTSTFHEITLSRISTTGSTSERIFFQSSQLFENITCEFRILVGPSGCGKSVFQKIIVDKWLGMDVDLWTFPGIDKYDIILLIDSTSFMTSSVEELIRLNYPKTLSFLPDDTIKSGITSHLSILFLVDGYDEFSENSKKDIKKLFQTHLKDANRRSFIVTTRRDASSDLCKFLVSKGIKHEVATIEPVSTIEEQIRFVRRYQEEMCNTHMSDMEDTFRLLPEAVKEALIYPLVLAMYCYSYKEDRKSVLKWKSDWHVFSSYMESCKTKMEIRCEVDDPSTVVDCLLPLIYEECLKLIVSSRYTFTQSEFDKILKTCFEETGKHISFSKVLSCILIAKTLSSSSEKTYGFFHVSFMEYLGAKYVALQLKKMDYQGKDKKCSDLIRKVISKGIGRSLHNNDYQR